LCSVRLLSSAWLLCFARFLSSAWFLSSTRLSSFCLVTLFSYSRLLSSSRKIHMNYLTHKVPIPCTFFLLIHFAHLKYQVIIISHFFLISYFSALTLHVSTMLSYIKRLLLMHFYYCILTLMLKCDDEIAEIYRNEELNAIFSVLFFTSSNLHLILISIECHE